MNIPTKFEKEFAAFPLVLRNLVLAEIAAGNAIVEIGAGFPAPPVGAWLKLAKPISTRPRKASRRVDFYDRNSSSYSGEFTDAHRFYFVLEPANSPEPYPDMDAIRMALETKPNASAITDRETSAPTDATARRPQRSANAASSDQAMTITETDTGWTRVLHFRDRRPPQDVQFALERTLMSLFRPAPMDGKWCLRTKATVNGWPYTFELRLDAALREENAYSLRVETSWASWAGKSATHVDYQRKSSVSWFAMWTRELKPANPPAAKAGSPTRYRELAEAALQSESSLDSVAAIQQVIVAAMQRGASFRTSDKESDTSIFWRDGRFRRSDSGDYPSFKIFADEAEFLNALRQFYDVTVTRNAGPDKPTDVDAWKLILRLLDA